MTNLLTREFPLWLERPVEHAFEASRSSHGDLGLDIKDYRQHLFAVLQKHCQTLEQRVQILDYLDHLSVNDLYLSVACGQSNNRAWKRFHLLYQAHIFQTAHRFCSSRMVADDVAENMVSHLYLADTAGNPRIQSYDGRVALTTWLRAIIAHKVVDELERKHQHFVRLDELPDLPDPLGLQKPESEVRANRYGTMITNALQKAFSTLEKSERLLLELLYVEELKSREVAELLGTCKSNITYHLKKVCVKLKLQVTEALKQLYHLNEEAIRECLDELLANPSYSVLMLINAKV